MAVKMGTPQQIVGLAAGSDLRNDRYLAVVQAADRAVDRQTAVGGDITGILQNAPNTGEACDIDGSGPSKAMAGGAFDPGVDLMVQATTGRLIAHTGDTANIVATSMGAGVDGRIVPINIVRKGRIASS